MFSENWHFNLHFVLKKTKTPAFFFSLLRFFDELFDVINDDLFLMSSGQNMNQNVDSL